jgi:hypothetical protein
VELVISAASNAGVETQSPSPLAAIAQAGDPTRQGKPGIGPNKRGKKLAQDSSKQVQEVAASALSPAKDAAGVMNLSAASALPPPTNAIPPIKAIIVPRRDTNTAAVAKPVAYNAMIALTNENVNAAVDYALKLSRVKSLTELVELSANHARKNIERIVIQTADLGWSAMSRFRRMAAILTGVQAAQYRTLIDHVWTQARR